MPLPDHALTQSFVEVSYLTMLPAKFPHVAIYPSMPSPTGLLANSKARWAYCSFVKNGYWLLWSLFFPLPKCLSRLFFEKHGSSGFAPVALGLLSVPTSCELLLFSPDVMILSPALPCELFSPILPPDSVFGNDIITPQKFHKAEHLRRGKIYPSNRM